jgi:SAM-dependent methyltransferase
VAVALQLPVPQLSAPEPLRHPRTGEALVRSGDQLRGVSSGDSFPIHRAGGEIFDLFVDDRGSGRTPARGSRCAWSRETFDAHYDENGAYETGEEYEAQQGGHPRLTEFHQSRVKRTLTQWLEPEAGHVILDVGCGAGWFLLKLKERYDARGLPVRSFGVDASRAQLANLARKTARERIPDVFAVLANAERLPFPDGAFDVVVSSEALEQIERPLFAIQEMARVLKPGGQLLVSMPSRMADELWDLALMPAVRLGKALLRRGNKAAEAFDQFYAPMYPGELRAFLEASELTITRFRQSGVIPHNHYFGFLPRPLIGPAVAAFEAVDRHFGEALAPLAAHVLVTATKR